MNTYKIYFAGDLFDQKHVTGNHLLAKKIEEMSNARYRCLLPQVWDVALTSAVGIRNRDITSIMRSDFVLFNFDGDDLDSGTVVEFMVAKMLDIPAVLLRTDFRNAGCFGEDWNPMATGFPRCATSKHHALVMYNELGLEKMHEAIARSVIDAFERVVCEKTLFSCRDEIVAAYQHVVKMCQGGLDATVSNVMINDFVDAKIAKAIYTVAGCSDLSDQYETLL